MAYSLFDNLGGHIADLKEIQRNIINGGDNIYVEPEEQLEAIQELQMLIENLYEFERDDSWKVLQQPRQNVSM